MTKRLVFCFDGTWNRLSTDKPTNVVKLAQMVCPVAPDGKPQLVYYDEGIGTSSWFIIRLIQGALGKGMLGIMREAYRFLIFNYEPGDEIFIFGFSRGAYTARSFAGFIRHAGILDVASASQIDKAIEIYRTAPAGITGMESLEAIKFRSEHCTSVCVSEDDHAYRVMMVPDFPVATPILTIRYLGVWDTVRALGVPDFLPFSKYFNRKYGFHDAVLTSKVKSARHAVALDERRRTFPPTMLGRAKVAELNEKVESETQLKPGEWERAYQEQWFPGVHGAVGGGGELRGLSDAALHWVLSGARRAGLAVRSKDNDVVFGIAPDPFEDVFNDPMNWKTRIIAKWHDWTRAGRAGPAHPDEIAHTTYRRWHQTDAEKAYSPRSLMAAAGAMADWAYREPPQWAGENSPPLEEYRTDHRDTLSDLAEERLGDKKRWPELFELNRDRIDDPDYLPTGAVLRLPARGAPHDDGGNSPRPSA